MGGSPWTVISAEWCGYAGLQLPAGATMPDAPMKTREDYEETYPVVLYDFALSLRIRHPTLSAKELKAGLRMRPKTSRTVGEGRKDRRGGPLPGIYRESYVLFHMKTRVGDELPDVISRMLAKLEHRRRFLDEIRATGGKLEFFVGIFVEGNKGVALAPDLLGRCAEMGIELGLDICGDSR